MATLLDDLTASMFGAAPGAQPQQQGGLLGLLGGSPQQMGQSAMGLLQAPAQPQFPRAPQPQGGGGQPPAFQPFMQPIEPQIPNFAKALAMRQAVPAGAQPAQPGPQPSGGMNNLLSLLLGGR